MMLNCLLELHSYYNYEYIGTRTSVSKVHAGAGAWTMNRLPLLPKYK